MKGIESKKRDIVKVETFDRNGKDIPSTKGDTQQKNQLERKERICCKPSKKHT